MKHVILKVDEEKYKLLKSMVKDMKVETPHVILSPVRRGNLGDDIIASFIVKDDHYTEIVEKLDNEDISLLGKARNKIPKKPSFHDDKDNNFRYSEIKTIHHHSPEAALDYAIKTGNYEKVIQISKDYRSGFELIKKAKENIETAVNNAIDIAYEKAVKSKFDVSKSLTQLIKIASDRNLKVIQKQDHVKIAGNKAIDLCFIYNEIKTLVQICNNNTMPHIICMNAALKLAYVLFSEAEKFEENVQFILKHLNLRWLDIVSITVAPELSEQDMGTYNTLISALKERSENRNNPS